MLLLCGTVFPSPALRLALKPVLLPAGELSIGRSPFRDTSRSL